mgnify:CR=1 FL=1
MNPNTSPFVESKSQPVVGEESRISVIAIPFGVVEAVACDNDSISVMIPVETTLLSCLDPKATTAAPIRDSPKPASLSEEILGLSFGSIANTENPNEPFLRSVASTLVLSGSSIENFVFSGYSIGVIPRKVSCFPKIAPEETKISGALFEALK